jgi:hypothetical protein
VDDDGWPELATAMVHAIGVSRVAHACGVDADVVAAWADRAAVPTERAAERLSWLGRAWAHVADAAGPTRATAWMTTVDDDGRTPLDAIRTGAYMTAMAAAWRVAATAC